MLIFSVVQVFPNWPNQYLLFRYYHLPTWCQQNDSDWLMLLVLLMSLVAFDWLLRRALATLLLGDQNQRLVVEQMFVAQILVTLTLKKINQLLVGLGLELVEKLEQN